MSEYICTNKFDTNECPNIFVKEKLIRTNVRIYIRDQYIRIFEYSNIVVTLCTEIGDWPFLKFNSSVTICLVLHTCKYHVWSPRPDQSQTRPDQTRPESDQTRPDQSQTRVRSDQSQTRLDQSQTRPESDQTRVRL